MHSLALLEPALMMVPSAESFFAAIGPVLATYEAGDRRAASDGFLQGVAGPDIGPSWTRRCRRGGSSRR
jgi:hypothetical protein